MSPSRARQRWTHDEMAQVVHGLRRGDPVERVAATCGRTPKAIQSIARRMIPKCAGLDGSTGDVGVEWLRVRLVRDPDYDWWDAYWTRRGNWYRKKHSRAAAGAPVDGAVVDALIDHPDPAVLREAVAAAVEGLRTPRLQRVLVRRLNLDGEGPGTLAEVGVDLGVTCERIRQLESEGHSALVRGLSRNDVVRRDLSQAVGDLSSETDIARFTSWIHAAYPTSDAGTIAQLLLCAHGYSAGRAKLHAASIRVCLSARAEAERRTAEAHAQQQRADEMVTRWVVEADWPATLGAVPPADELSRAREIDETSSTTAGVVASTKLSRYVAYESSTEFRVVRVLERSSLVAYYQEQPYSIPYTDDDGFDRVYYPDLFVVFTGGRGLLIEVKPVLDRALASVRRKADAARVWAHRRGWGWVMLDAQHDPRALFKYTVPAPAAAAFERRLLNGHSMRWSEIRELRDEQGVDAFGLAALVVQRGWVWEVVSGCRLRAAPP